MKVYVLLFLLAMMLYPSTADQIVAYQGGNHLHDSSYKQITIIQTLTYTYQLVSQNTWLEHPALSLNLNISFPQIVEIKYQAQNYAQSDCHFCTRVIVDGYQQNLLRYITGNTYFHTNVASAKIRLNAGRHYIAVQYRGTCQWPVIRFEDWQINYIMATYYQKIK